MDVVGRGSIGEELSSRLDVRSPEYASVFVRGRSRVFLGGPPLVKMATDEDADEEELGGVVVRGYLGRGVAASLGRDPAGEEPRRAYPGTTRPATVATPG